RGRRIGGEKTRQGGGFSGDAGERGGRPVKQAGYDQSATHGSGTGGSAPSVACAPASPANGLWQTLAFAGTARCRAEACSKRARTMADVPYEVFVGLRYTRARRGAGRNRFVSFISAVSMLGIALGVAALIVVLSVMNGFQEELRTRILAVAAHIEVRALNGAMANWPAVARAARTNPRVRAEAPYVLGQAMVSSGEVNRGALVRGIDPALEDKVADIGSHMRAGSLADLRPGAFGIVLGAELARALGVRVGDSVVVITPQGTVTPAGTLPRVKSFHVVGLFEIGMFEFDSGLALINLSDAQKLYRLGETVSGVRLKLDDLFAAPQVARE